MPSYRFFIGIDISKKTIDVCLTADGDKAQMPHARFANGPKGFRAMLRFIKRNGNGTPCDKWLFCMEHTGVYTLLVCAFLQERGLAHTLVSPHRLLRSIGLRRGKSDRADAGDIARYACLFRGELRPAPPPGDTLLAIKALLSLRGRLVRANKGLVTASGELGAFTRAAVNRFVAGQTAMVVRRNKKAIRAVEAEVERLIQADEGLSRLYGLVTSVKGIGPVIGAYLLVHTNRFTAFPGAKQFACYIGVAPFERSSGTSLRTPARVSHMANKRLKGLLSNGASAAIRHDRQIREYYERKVAQGKNRFSVRNAVVNKLIRRVFAVVKRGSQYVELHRHKA